MKKILFRVLAAFVTVFAMTGCVLSWEEERFVSVYASSATISFDGETADGYKYTLVLSGAFKDTNEEFQISMVFYDNLYTDKGDKLVPLGEYYGSNVYKKGYFLFGSTKDRQGSFVKIKDRGDFVYDYYAIDGGKLVIDTYEKRDGTIGFDLETDVNVGSYRYDILYKGDLYVK